MNLYFAHPYIKDKKSRLLKIILNNYWKVIDPFEENIGIDYDDIVRFDYTLIDTCDIVFAYIPESNHRNIGIVCEMLYAKSLGKLVYCLTYKENPFLDHYCDQIFYSIDDFCNNC